MVTLRVDVEKFKGGNINCFEKWANIEQDQFVLYIIKFGLTMELLSILVIQLSYYPFNTNFFITTTPCYSI